MCGIAGFTRWGEAAYTENAQTLIDLLVHRGPDQQGVWESADVSLCAVRLKVIDLDGGDQPIISPESGTVICFNGEIFNYRELRRELAQQGCRFASDCDTEVVLRAFEVWDVGAFSRLRGMFGVALWQPDRRRLVVARDRMGIKPVYIARRGENLYFASELKAILAHPEIERRLDPAGLASFLTRNFIAGRETMVAGIEKLPPGSWISWEEGRVQTERYWKLKFDPSPASLEESTEQLEGLIRDAVREQMVADVPLGVWSSGGLDSTTILHYASQESSRQLKTFSIAFHGRDCDETPYFRRAAEAYDTDHYELNLDANLDLADTIEELTHYADEPSADAGALPIWYLSKLTRRQCTVALSGEGADELFGGYNTYLADRYARWLQWVPRPLRAAGGWMARQVPVSDRKIGLDYKLVRMLEGSLLPADEAHAFWNGTFTRNDLASLTTLNGELEGLPRGPVGSGADLNRFLWTDQLTYLPNDILNKTDRMSMAHALEVRPPFLDHRIVEFAAGLELDHKIQGTQMKRVLRRLMRRHLPALLLQRKKEGLDIPIHAWFRTTLRPLLLDTLNQRTIQDTGVLDWSYVESVLDAHLNRQANLGYHLWGLLALTLWMKRWNVSWSAEPMGAVSLIT